MIYNPRMWLGYALAGYLTAKAAYEDTVSEWGNYRLKVETTITEFYVRCQPITEATAALFADSQSFDVPQFKALLEQKRALATEEDQALVAILDSYYEAVSGVFLVYREAAAKLLVALDFLGDEVRGVLPVSYERGNLRNEGGVDDKLITQYNVVRDRLATRHKQIA